MKTVAIRFFLAMMVGILLLSSTRIIEAKTAAGGLVDLYDPRNKNKTLYVYMENGGHQKDEFNEAVQRWNNTNLVDLRYTSNKNKADIVFNQSSNRYNGIVTGKTVPCKAVYNSKGQKTCQKVSTSSRWDYASIYGYPNEMNEANYSWSERVKVYVHELGHALGLAHPSSSQCSHNPGSSVMCTGRQKASYPTSSDRNDFQNKWNAARKKEEERLTALGLM